jgi:large subunit ribosomal protein L9
MRFVDDVMETILASRCKELSGLKIWAKATDDGRIFGSITTVALACILEENGVYVERKDIEINGGEPIKRLGFYKARIKPMGKHETTVINFEVIME